MIESILRKKYQIEVYDDVAYYLARPITALYDRLASVKRDVFPNDYRIVFSINTPVEQDFLNYLQKVLSRLDIPNYFVLIVSNQKNMQTQILTAYNGYALDSVPMSLVFHDAPTAPVPKNQTNFKIPDSICVNPWINIEITNSGRFKPCCEYTEFIPNADVNTSSFNDVYRSEYMTNLRTDFLAGKTPDACNRCYEQERIGKLSKRLRDNYVYRDNLLQIDWNNVTKNQLASLDVKLGYTCNLACRICGPAQSSAWVSEVKTNNLTAQYPIIQLNKADWTQDDDSLFWNDFREVKSSLRHIEFTGGEPLLIKKHFAILQYLVDQDVAKHIDLHYNSNGTVYPEQAIEIWNHFKHVGISFSIDNICRRFEYERYGETWDTVESTIDQFLTLNNSRFSFDIYCTLSALNVADAYRVYQFGKSKNLPVEYSILYEPNELSMDILTKQAKQYIIDTLTCETDKGFIDKITPILNKLKTGSTDVSIDKFWNTINLLDSTRGQLFSDYYSDLYKLLKD